MRPSPTHPQAPVAIASCAGVVGSDPDDLRVIAALRQCGIAAAHAAWDDAAVDWSAFRLVVVRSTWDYPDRCAEFLAWAGKLPRVLNPFPVLRWNTDKRYLDDLAAAGLPVIPTRFLGPSDGFDPPRTPFVVKPAISCGAKDSARYEPDEIARAREHVRRLQAEGRTAMIQPYLTAIDTRGEVALHFIAGAYSHAIHRGALLTPGTPPGDGPGMPHDVTRHEATTAERALAERVLRHVPGGAAGLLYARVDLVPGPDGEPLILEVELTEPALFLAFSDDGAARLAGGIAAALRLAPGGPAR